MDQQQRRLNAIDIGHWGIAPVTCIILKRRRAEAEACLDNRPVCRLLMFNAGITACHGVELIVKLGEISQSGDRDRSLEAVGLGDKRIDAIAAETLPHDAFFAALRFSGIEGTSTT